MQRNLRGDRGFTLIELLVVTAIIALLASVVLASLNTARSKARDARRLSDMKQIQTALEFYYSDHTAYPVSATQNTDAAGFTTALSGIVSGAFIATIPNDPSGGAKTYYYKSTSDGSFYCLGANTENTSPTSSCNTTTLGGAITGVNYAVGP